MHIFFQKRMAMTWVLHSFFALGFLTSCIMAQQKYSANSVMDCNNNDTTNPSPAFLYSCNGQNSSCLAYLIFQSLPPYNSVPTISALLSSNHDELARTNKVTGQAVFPIGKEVIVPVNCSCLGQYYQANTTFHIQSNNETYFTIANNSYEGLSTCDSLKRANIYSEFELYPSLELNIPLRCACPTKRQAENGTRHLVTYSVFWEETILKTSERYNTSPSILLDANGFSEENPTLFPFTTILIPLHNEPLSSQTTIQNHNSKISPPLFAVIEKNTSKGNLPLTMKTGVALGCSALVLIIIICIIRFFHKTKINRVSKSNKEEKPKGKLSEDLLVEIASFGHVLQVYNFKELKKATENFGSKSIIKGCVYRGEFKGETRVIKKMTLDVSMEVNLLQKINHVNLIKLHGFCKTQGCFYLVFEYMKNGSLKEWLRSRSSRESSTCARRLQIALDIANGLHYLHNFTKPAYVHKDIKSSNVLLDSNLRAKIANFSQARTAMKETTTRIVGSRGYLAPEYIEKGLVSPEIDVYSFGVVLSELITGKGAVIIQKGQEVLLATAVASIMERGNAETAMHNLIDPALAETGIGMEHTLRLVRLSLSCLACDPGRRPCMGEVVSTLVRIQVDIGKYSVL